MKVKTTPILALLIGLISLSLPACQSMQAEEKETHEEHSKIVVTTPEARDVTVTQPYVCQIRSQRYAEIRPLMEGYLEAVPVKEGQAVKQGDVLFRVLPVLYSTRLDAERAKANLARIKYENTVRLFQSTPPVVSIQQVNLEKAELDEANARVKTAEAELNFATVRAPFDGIIDRQYQQQGSLVKKEDLLTTLSDNSTMWVFFNVPEARYLEYKAHQTAGKEEDSQHLKLVDTEIDLILANGSKFPYSPGNTVTVEGKFNNETGNIAFRADFPNPNRLLRHGQTGTIQLRRKMKNAVVIPQRAAFEILDKQYVWVVGDDHVVHQRLITVEHELEDIFVIKSGLSLNDKIILEGVQQVRDGEKVEYDLKKPGDALAHQKYHAE
jgi:membrane fusion protein (multidrug efflux system)